MDMVFSSSADIISVLLVNQRNLTDAAVMGWVPHVYVGDKYSYTGTLVWQNDVTKCKHFPRCWSFVRRIHRSSVGSHHKGQWRGALIFSLICAWTNGRANNPEAGDLIRYRAHYDVILMESDTWLVLPCMFCMFTWAVSFCWSEHTLMH